MFFSASERLAEATADFGDLAERFDTWLKDANESWLLDSPRVASSLREPVGKVEVLLERAASPKIGLLVGSKVIRCPNETCGDLVPLEDLEKAREDEEPISCPLCGEDLKDARPTVVYRLADEAAAEARKRHERPHRRLAILTALKLELDAVLARLSDQRRENSPQGTVYLVGTFETDSAVWEIATAFIGAGNADAAVEAERVITHFEPEAVFFVGIAGGIKDVELADVVVPDQVFLWQSGKATKAFQANPVGYRPSQGLLSNARATIAANVWQARILDPLDRRPNAVSEPIVAGDQVVASTGSTAFRQIRETYARAVAVEMEGAGFLRGTYGNPGVASLLVRGISDLLDDKGKTDAGGWQDRAADHAAAFAFEVIANIP